MSQQFSRRRRKKKKKKITESKKSSVKATHLLYTYNYIYIYIHINEICRKHVFDVCDCACAKGELYIWGWKHPSVDRRNMKTVKRCQLSPPPPPPLIDLIWANLGAKRWTLQRISRHISLGRFLSRSFLRVYVAHINNDAISHFCVYARHIFIVRV